MVSFQCSFGNTDLCLNNGSCAFVTFEIPGDNGTTIESTNGELTCTCPNGWEHDNTFFHFPSCTLPTNTYLGFLIYYSIVTFLLVFLIVREFWTISHGKTRTIAISNLMALVLSWCQLLCVFFQNGAFEGNAIFAALSLSASFFMGGKLSISFMETLHAVRRMPLTKFREALRICTIIACVVSFVLGLAMIGTCRMSSTTHNMLVWFLELWILIWTVFFCGVVGYYTHLLLGNVTHASTLRGATAENRRAIRELILKVRIIRNASLYNAIILTAVGLPKSIAFLVLGSVPFQWIFAYVLCYNGLTVISLGILAFVRHTRNAKKKQKQTQGEHGEDDDNSSPAAADTDDGDGVGPIDKKKRKEHGLHNDGKNGRTWLFRGSSLMTKQGNKDITKMTYDQDNNLNIVGGTPQVANGPAHKHISGSPKRAIRVVDE